MVDIRNYVCTLFTLYSVTKPLGEEKVVSSRLLVPTRIANLTRITEKMPTTENSVILVVDCISNKSKGMAADSAITMAISANTQTA